MAVALNSSLRVYPESISSPYSAPFASGAVLPAAQLRMAMADLPEAGGEIICNESPQPTFTVGYSAIWDFAHPGTSRDHSGSALDYLHRHQLLKKAYIFQKGLLSLPDARCCFLPRPIHWTAPLSRCLPDGLLYRLRNSWFDRSVAQQMEAFDVFHTFEDTGTASIRAARGKGALTFVERPAVHVDHMTRVCEEEARLWGCHYLPHDPPFTRSRRKSAHQAADHVLVLSDYARETYLEAGARPESVSVVPLGVDATRFHPPSLSKEDHPFRLLYVGKVCLYKGIQYLLEAWKQLALPDGELWIAGKVFSDGQHLLDRYRGLPNVRLLGFCDPAEIYRQCSAFCLPSLSEGFGLVTLEAMASGLPVLVNECCQASVRSDIDGKVLPARNVEALVEAIRLLYRNPDLCVTMGKEARARAEDCSWDSYGRRLVEVYRQQLSK